MLKKLHKNVVHNSLPVETLDAPVDGVILQMRKLARFLTVISPHTPSADLVLHPGDREHDLNDMTDLRDLVAESTLAPLGEFGIRLSVITNETAYSNYRSQYPGHPINNWHTDFRVRKTHRGGELYAPKNNRLVVIVDGEGTATVRGEVRARRAEEFALDRVGSGFEHLMEDRKLTLLGADGQIIRGPKSNSLLHQFRGDYEYGELPEGVWCELSSSTLHQSPSHPTRGRAVLNVDSVD